MHPSSFSVQIACTLLVVSTLIGCDSPTESPSQPVPVDKQVAADVFGDHDGTASTAEMLALDDFFGQNDEGWSISMLSQELWKSNEATTDQVRTCFVSMTTRPYPSEQALRQDYEGINIRTPFVSIIVLRNKDQLEITKFFRSPGPGISSARWEALIVK